MRRATVNANGIELDVRAMGDPGAPLLLFLHGFPEHAGAWDDLLPAFAQRYHAVAPNQRGYGLSSKPGSVEAYRIKHLVRDMLALADLLSADRSYQVVAHDWGASVGYAMAIAAPRRIGKLAVVNGVHPGPFQRALIEDEAQRAASSYIHYLRDARAEERLSANGYAKLMGMLTHFGEQAWLTPERRAAYLDAWSQPGALTGMLNWYRATPLVVPKPGEAVDMASVPRFDPAQLRIRMPHLLIWGMQDPALLPVARAGLAEYCDHGVVLREIQGADHWVVHQKTAEVIDLIRGFLDA